MIDFRSGREPKSSSFDYISIRIAAPEEIRGPRDPKERERIIRSIGDVMHAGYHVIPIVDLPALFGLNQKKVGEWKTTGYYGFTHLEYVQKR